MRVMLGVWMLAILIAASVPNGASATGFVLADPGVDPAWGQQQAQPIAPTRTRAAESELPPEVVGKARNAAYLEALRGSRPTLDEAAAYHFYAPIEGIYVRPDHVPFAPVTGAEAAAEAEVLAAKAREAEPALVAELDARFEALTTVLERADAIALPPAGAPAVTYCRWIGLAYGTQPSQLGKDLWRHCLADRDRFIGVLVRRLADLAEIPDLPASDAAPAPDAGNRAVAGDLILPNTVLPGETLAPIPYASLAAAFDERLRARFDAARPRLEARLGEALAKRAASDVVLPPTYECNGLLGPYAGPLARLPAAAGVANALSQACLPAAERQIPAAVERIRHNMLAGFENELARVRAAAPDASRIERTPEAVCAAQLAPHFPAPVPHYDANAWPFAGLDAAQSTALRQACVEAAAQVLRAVMDKHFALALAQSVPDPDTLAGWAAHGWYAVPPGGMDWIGTRNDPLSWSTLRQKYQSEYDAAMGPRRKAAAVRFVAEIERGAAVDADKEPSTDSPCASRKQNPADAALSALLGIKTDPAAEARSLDALRAKPALSPAEAEALVAGTCRTIRNRALAARVADAMKSAGVDRTFAEGERLAVPRHEDGRLLEVDVLALVQGAAADGIRVTFKPGGLISNPSMSIAPLDGSSSPLAGTLHEETEDDGTKVLVIRNLNPLQGLRTPEDTITCLLTPVDQAAGEARLNAIGAVAGAMFSHLPELHGPDVRDAMARGVAVEACRAAKAAFTGRPGSPMR